MGFESRGTDGSFSDILNEPGGGWAIIRSGHPRAPATCLCKDHSAYEQASPQLLTEYALAEEDGTSQSALVSDFTHVHGAACSHAEEGSPIPLPLKILVALNLMIRISVIFCNSIGTEDYKQSWETPTEHIGSLVLYHTILLGIVVNAIYTYNEACHHYTNKDIGFKLPVATVVAIPFGFFGYNLCPSASVAARGVIAAASFGLNIPVPMLITGTHVVELVKGTLNEEIKHILNMPDLQPDLSTYSLIFFGVCVVGLTVPDEIAVASSIFWLPSLGQLAFSCVSSSLETVPHMTHWQFYEESRRLFQGFDWSAKCWTVVAAIGHGADGLAGMYTLDGGYYQLWVLTASVTEMIVALPEMIFHRHSHKHKSTPVGGEGVVEVDFNDAETQPDGESSSIFQSPPWCCCFTQEARKTCFNGIDSSSLFTI